MSEAADSVVISFRGPKALAERLEKVAKRRMVGKGVVQREALELYLALGERSLRVVQYLPGAFDDTASESGGGDSTGTRRRVGRD